MSLEAGYDPRVVYDYLAAHTTRRDDGRYLTFNRREMDDTHRDTFDRWYARANSHAGVNVGDEPWERVPLERWDEVLLIYGVMLHEFEQWAEENCGWNGFLPSGLLSYEP